MAAFEYRQAEEIRDALQHHEVSVSAWRLREKASSSGKGGLTACPTEQYGRKPDLDLEPKFQQPPYGGGTR
jgi:hypothetical protein